MATPDPVSRQLRDQLSDVDRAIVDAVNERLKLAARLKQYEEAHGVGLVDPEREEWMFRYLARANRGPLTADGLRELYTELVALTKREIDRADA